jgi:glucokinase
MTLYYLLWLLLINGIMLGSEQPAITTHVTDFAQYETLLLCTNSGHSEINYGIFAINNHTPLLILSSYIKNENCENFTNTIVDILNRIKNDYNITVKYACFAGPGVPSIQQDYLTHIRLPYVINAKEIITASGLTSAIIVNDFLAMSYGIDFLNDKSITTLYEVPSETHGKRAIIGAGNGLGSVSMSWNNNKQRYDSFPAEMGTGDFPAHNQFEFDLAMGMKQLRNMKTVHWANFVSLSGIQYTYQMLKSMNENCSDISDTDGMNILTHANNDDCCKEAANLFFKFYARFTYNFVWATLPFGGIYLIGDTAALYPELLSKTFLPEYFNCVESKREVLKRIPIYIIKDDMNTTLYGTAQYFNIHMLLNA